MTFVFQFSSSQPLFNFFSLSILSYPPPHTATLRLSGAIEKSAEVMKNMQDLVKVSDVARTMR